MEDAKFSRTAISSPPANGYAERGPVGAMFDYGKKDYFLGGSPIWELFRVAYQMTKPPVFIGGLALLSGFCWAALQRIERPVSRELMQFRRREQMKTLRAILGTIIRFKKVEKFYLETQRNSSR